MGVFLEGPEEMCYLNGWPQRFLIIVTLVVIKSANANEPKQMKKEVESFSSWFPFVSVYCGLFFWPCVSEWVRAMLLSKQPISLAL